jgi:hypothetical protein
MAEESAGLPGCFSSPFTMFRGRRNTGRRKKGVANGGCGCLRAEDAAVARILDTTCILIVDSFY